MEFAKVEDVDESAAECRVESESRCICIYGEVCESNLTHVTKCACRTLHLILVEDHVASFHCEVRPFTANVNDSTPKTPVRRTYVCGYN